MTQPIWNKFCQRFKVNETCVPLFATDDDEVKVRTVGRDDRPVLMRSEECDAKILAETDLLVADWKSGSHKYDGMIYMMGWMEDAFIPLYIGKTETLGKGDGNLSVNIKNLHTDRSKFARWGDGYQYHIGDLSACVLGHENKQTLKYASWAKCLFASGTQLKRPVYFWAKAWDASEVGVWEEYGPTSLAFLEYLLIGVAGKIYPDLLNRKGLSR
jgi:hypothetical protein